MQNNGIISFEAMNLLFDEVVEFFDSIPEYHDIEIESNLVPVLVSNQYILTRDKDGEINCFISYWKTDEKGFKSLVNQNKPEEIHRGPVIYGLECGSKLSKNETYKILNQIRTREPYTIFCFHNKGKFKVFRRQL